MWPRNSLSNSVERYDFETKAWETVAPMAVSREAAGVAVLDAKLYAVGGHTGAAGEFSNLVRPLLGCMGGVGADGEGAGMSRRGGARWQAVRRGWLPLRQLGGAVRPGYERVGGGGADGDCTV